MSCKTSRGAVFNSYVPSGRAGCHLACEFSPWVPRGQSSAYDAELPAPPAADWSVPPVGASFSSPQSSVSSTHHVLEGKQVFSGVVYWER